jgi:hypothetical protein
MARCTPGNVQSLPVRWPIVMRNCSSAVDHSPDLQANSAAVTTDCQVETKLGPIFVVNVPVRN